MTRTPRYREIEEHLRRLVATAQPGDLLPTVAELCELFDVSGVQTIRNAYEPLIAEGLVGVQMRPRRRWFVQRVPRVNPASEDDGGEWDLLAARDALIDATEAVATAQANIERLLRNIGEQRKSRG